MPAHPLREIRLSDEVWRDNVEILRARDVGALFRLTRKYAGASQNRISAATGVPQSRVNALMTGRSGSVTALEVFERIADGLGMPDHARVALGLAPRRMPPAATGSEPVPGNLFGSSPGGSDVLDVPPGGEDVAEVVLPCRALDGRIIWVSVPRRAFLVAGATAMASPRTAHSVAGWSGRTSEASPREHLERFRDVLVESDNLLGPRHLIPTVRQQIEVIGHLRGTCGGADRQGLLHLQAEYAEFASWLFHDAGDYTCARYWTDRALEWATAVADDAMAAYVLARKSQLAGDTGQAAEAVDLGEAAASQAPPRSRLRAAALTYAAHGYAMDALRGRSTCLSYLDEARATLEAAGTQDESPWAVWLNPAYIEVQRGRCLSLLGEHTRAAATFTDAVASLPSGFHRDRGVYLARQALAHAEARQPEQAAQVGRGALAVAVDTRSGRIVNELAHLDDRLAGWPDLPTVTDFRTELTSVIPHEKA